MVVRLEHCWRSGMRMIAEWDHSDTSINTQHLPASIPGRAAACLSGPRKAPEPRSQGPQQPCGRVLSGIAPAPGARLRRMPASRIKTQHKPAARPALLGDVQGARAIAGAPHIRTGNCRGIPHTPSGGWWRQETERKPATGAAQ